MRPPAALLLMTMALAVLASPFVAAAQQGKGIRRIGLLVPSVWDPNHPQIVAFRQRLKDLGYSEGQDIVYEPRGGSVDKLPYLAAELVQHNPDILVAWAPVATAALRQRTTSIPIVIAAGGDPVEAGFVASFARPGGNVTGVSAVSTQISAKNLELLREAVPTVSRIGVLWDAQGIDASRLRKTLEAAGMTLRLQLEWAEAAQVGDLARAFEYLQSKRVEAVLVTDQARNYNRPREIAEITLRRRIPAMCGEPVSVRSGCLLGYTPDWVELSRVAATYVDRILRGAKPAELPIEFATRFNLLINLKTARALGLAIAPSLMARADQIIE